MKRAFCLVGVLMLAATGMIGCGDENKNLAPTATGSTLGSSAPATKDSKAFKVDGGASTVGFNMEAPIEKIRGRVEGTIEGELFIDVAELSKTRGNLVVDLSSLVIFQKKKAGDEFGDEVKSEKQNEHAREWLQIDPKTDEPDRTKNRRIEFKIKSIENVSKNDISKENGEVKVTLKAVGDFLLHGRTSVKNADLEVTLNMEGGKITNVSVKTKSPFAVNLEEHEVHPRDAVGKVLAIPSDKVGKDAMVEFNIQLKPDGSKMSEMPKAPPSAEPPKAGGSASAASSSAPATSSGPAASGASSANPK